MENLAYVAHLDMYNTIEPIHKMEIKMCSNDLMTMHAGPLEDHMSNPFITLGFITDEKQK